MTKRWGLMLGLAVALATVTPALGQTVPDVGQSVPEVAQVAPQGALAIVVVKNLSELNDKIEGFAKKLGTPLPFSPLEKFQQEHGLEKALDTKGSAIMAVMPGKDEDAEPMPVVFLPVTDYGEMMEGLSAKKSGEFSTVEFSNGKKMVVAPKGKYAVMTEPRYVAALRMALKAKSAGSALAPAGSWLAGHDVSAIVTTDGVKLFAKKAQEGVGKVEEKSGQIPEQFQYLLGWLKGVKKFLGTVETDVSYVALGAKIDKSGNLVLESRTDFVEDGRFAKAAADVQPTTNPLIGLPELPYVMAMGFACPKGGASDLMKGMLQLITSMAKDVPEEKSKEFVAAAEGVTKHLRHASAVMGVGKGEDPIMSGMASVMKVDDAETFLDAYVKYITVSNDFMEGLKLPNMPKQAFKARKTTLGDRPAAEVTLEMKLEDQPAMMQKFMELYLGPGGKATITMVAADKNTVIASYKGPAGAKELLKESANSALAEDKNVAKTLAALPKGSQWVVLLDGKGSVDFANRILAAVPQAGGFQLPEFPATPPLGIGVNLTSTALEARLTMPASLTQSIGAYVQQLKRLKGGA